MTCPPIVINLAATGIADHIRNRDLDYSGRAEPGVPTDGSLPEERARPPGR